jgi:hypothetical protein
MVLTHANLTNFHLLFPFFFQLDNVSAYLFTKTIITTVVRFLLSLNIVIVYLCNIEANV